MNANAKAISAVAALFAASALCATAYSPVSSVFHAYYDAETPTSVSKESGSQLECLNFGIAERLAVFNCLGIENADRFSAIGPFDSTNRMTRENIALPDAIRSFPLHSSIDINGIHDKLVRFINYTETTYTGNVYVCAVVPSDVFLDQIYDLEYDDFTQISAQIKDLASLGLGEPFDAYLEKDPASDLAYEIAQNVIPTISGDEPYWDSNPWTDETFYPTFCDMTDADVASLTRLRASDFSTLDYNWVRPCLCGVVAFDGQIGRVAGHPAADVVTRQYDWTCELGYTISMTNGDEVVFKPDSSAVANDVISYSTNTVDSSTELTASSSASYAKSQEMNVSGDATLVYSVDETPSSPGASGWQVRMACPDAYIYKKYSYKPHGIPIDKTRSGVSLNYSSTNLHGINVETNDFGSMMWGSGTNVAENMIFWFQHNECNLTYPDEKFASTNMLVTGDRESFFLKSYGERRYTEFNRIVNGPFSEFDVLRAQMDKTPRFAIEEFRVKLPLAEEAGWKIYKKQASEVMAVQGDITKLDYDEGGNWCYNDYYLFDELYWTTVAPSETTTFEASVFVPTENDSDVVEFYNDVSVRFESFLWTKFNFKFVHKRQ